MKLKGSKKIKESSSGEWKAVIKEAQGPTGARVSWNFFSLCQQLILKEPLTCLNSNRGSYLIVHCN